MSRGYWILLLGLAACGPGRECTDALDCGEQQTCFVDAQRDASWCVDAPSQGDPTPARRHFRIPQEFDLLFTIDDSLAGLDGQRRLLEELDAFAAALERPWSPAAYRIGVITADVGHSGCDPATNDGGRLVGTSCLDRLDDFIGPDGADHTALCTERCRLDTAAMMAAMDDGRPWVDARSKSPTVELSDVLACLLPQGVSGCEWPNIDGGVQFFEGRQSAPGEPEHGFRRRDAVTYSIPVSGRLECSKSEDPSGMGCWELGDPCSFSSSPLCGTIEQQKLVEAFEFREETAVCLRPTGDAQSCPVAFESPTGFIEELAPCDETEDGPVLREGQQRCFAHRDPSVGCFDDAASKLVFLSTNALEEEAYLVYCDAAG